MPRVVLEYTAARHECPFGHLHQLSLWLPVVTSCGVKGAFFATAQLGVRAHIQHLLSYSSTREPSEPVIDPRYQLVRDSYGTRTLGTWEDLNGRWAVPGYTYGQSILSMFRAMLTE